MAKDLLNYCIHIVGNYDCDSIAVEDYASDFFTSHCTHLGDSEKIFIQEVFSGCICYKSVLDVVITGYYNSDGRYALNSEKAMYKVMLYLVLLRLDELGVDQFKQLISTQSINKTYKFLNFALNDKHILTWIKDEWNKLYEEQFVQEILLEPLLRWLPRLQQMLEKMRRVIENPTVSKKSSLPLTEQKPFNITQPQLKRVPMPEQIPVLGKSKPAPKTTYECPYDQQVLEQKRVQNRLKSQELLNESQRERPPYTQTGKSAKTLQRMQKIVDEENSKLRFEGVSKAKCVPVSVLSENVPIKLNTTAILREEQLYRKREEDELKKLERLEAGEGDASAFIAWQTRMKAIDLEKQFEEIEQRRLSGLLSQEEAVIARKQLIQHNKDRVAIMKAEAQVLLREYMIRQLEEQEKTRKLMDKVASSHENAKEVKRQLQAYKSSIVQTMNEEYREMMQQALEEAEAEMRQKMELIQEIRAMEAVSAARQPRVIDLTETGGYGLLCEMSIVELRERLGLLKIAEQEREAAKRDQIITDKQVKTQMLLDKLDTISKHRAEQSKAAASKSDERRKIHMAKARPPRPANSVVIMEMEQILADRRAERQRLEEQFKIGNKPSSLKPLSADRLPQNQLHEPVKSRTGLLAA